MPEARFEMICPCEDAALFESIRLRAERLPNLVFHNGVPYREVQSHYDRARGVCEYLHLGGLAEQLYPVGPRLTALLSLIVRPDTLFEDFQLGACTDGDRERFLALAREWFADRAATDAMGREAERFVRELHDNMKETDAFLAGLPAAKR